MVFFALRQRQHTVQALLVVNPESISKQMAKWAAGIPLESIVLVEGVVKKSPEEIKGATIKDAEIHITKVSMVIPGLARIYEPFRRRFISFLKLRSGYHSTSKMPTRHRTTNVKSQRSNSILA